jgi:hypothetical protein
MHMLIRLSWQTLVFVEDSHSTAAGSFEAPLQGKELKWILRLQSFNWGSVANKETTT